MVVVEVEIKKRKARVWLKAGGWMCFNGGREGIRIGRSRRGRETVARAQGNGS